MLQRVRPVFGSSFSKRIAGPSLGFFPVEKKRSSGSNPPEAKVSGQFSDHRWRSRLLALSAFDDKSHEPLPDEVAEALGEAAGLWTHLLENIRSDFYPLSVDWGVSVKMWGWALSLNHKKRAVLYLTP